MRQWLATGWSTYRTSRSELEPWRRTESTLHTCIGANGRGSHEGVLNGYGDAV